MPEWTGRTIGNVRIDKELARGGMAEVYVGTHLRLDRLVIVKVMHSYIEADPELQSRFENEARVVAALRHPNIVQIFDFDIAEGHPYIVMEYLRGPSLAAYLSELNSRNAKLPPLKLRLFNIGTALDYAHERGSFIAISSQATLSCTTKRACFQVTCHSARSPSLPSQISVWSASIQQRKRPRAKEAGRQPICPLSRRMV
jgi:serine/threonine-protein kinase